MNRSSIVLVTSLVATFVTPSLADVVVPPPTVTPPKEKAKERREERKDAREERREAAKERVQAMRESRKERRKERRVELEKKWGGLFFDPSARAELTAHARRTARLQRVLVVAEEEKDQASIDKVKKLLAREDERHQTKMAHFKEETKR